MGQIQSNRSSNKNRTREFNPHLMTCLYANAFTADNRNNQLCFSWATNSQRGNRSLYIPS